jgi:S1-C subfamily serine protease
VARVLVVVVLLGLGGALAYLSRQLDHLSTRLDEANDRLAVIEREQEEGTARHETLAARVAELERAAGEVFDPEAIAEAVLPSVFKVVAGDVTGTAFAIGPEADDGGTNMFTNYHVVEQVWLGGGPGVFLERADRRYPAEVIEVDRSADVAWLRTDDSFPGLPPVTGQLRAGQPIVAVGAPLGLGDTITTGVVSNTDRELPDGTGPWIQFDAAVSPGNSGGPVINAAQQVVGIATRKATDFEGIGFAVPIGTACDLFDICG